MLDSQIDKNDKWVGHTIELKTSSEFLESLTPKLEPASEYRLSSEQQSLLSKKIHAHEMLTGILESHKGRILQGPEQNHISTMICCDKDLFDQELWITILLEAGYRNACVRPFFAEPTYKPAPNGGRLMTDAGSSRVLVSFEVS